jgi:hypothetical protein
MKKKVRIRMMKPKTVWAMMAALLCLRMPSSMAMFRRMDQAAVLPY